MNKGRNEQDFEPRVKYHQNNSREQYNRRSPVDKNNHTVRETGIIEKLLEKKYGFIECCERKNRIFFNISEYKDSVENLKPGDRVEFEIDFDPATGKPKAAKSVTKYRPSNSSSTGIVFNKERIDGFISTALHHESGIFSGRVCYQTKDGKKAFLPYCVKDIETKGELLYGDKVNFIVTDNSGKQSAGCIRLIRQPVRKISQDYEQSSKSSNEKRVHTNLPYQTNNSSSRYRERVHHEAHLKNYPVIDKNSPSLDSNFHRENSSSRNKSQDNSYTDEKQLNSGNKELSKTRGRGYQTSLPTSNNIKQQSPYIPMPYKNDNQEGSTSKSRYEKGSVPSSYSQESALKDSSEIKKRPYSREEKSRNEYFDRRHSIGSDEYRRDDHNTRSHYERRDNSNTNIRDDRRRSSNTSRYENNDFNSETSKQFNGPRDRYSRDDRHVSQKYSTSNYNGQHSDLNSKKRHGRHDQRYRHYNDIPNSSRDSRRNDDNYKTPINSDDDLLEDLVAIKTNIWTRSAPDDLFYTRSQTSIEMRATERTQKLCEKFDDNLVQKSRQARLEAEELGRKKLIDMKEQEKKDRILAKKLKKDKIEKERKKKLDKKGQCCIDKKVEKLKSEEKEINKLSSNNEMSSTKDNKINQKVPCKCDSSESSSSESTSSSDDDDDEGLSRSDNANRELERRKKHPKRLHTDLWHNEPGLMNDGPVCRCSAKARRFGIRHGYYSEEPPIPKCEQFSNNPDKLFHYKINISPPNNFLVNKPTVIEHDKHEYIFEGFSIFSHYPLDLNLPSCKMIRFNIKYEIFVEEEKFPESFCVQELDLFETYLFHEVLELVDIKSKYGNEHCPQFHLMPRFVRELPNNGKEILSMNKVLLYLLKNDKELIKESELVNLLSVEQDVWQKFADKHKGTVVAKWGMKPSTIRVDQIDREVSDFTSCEESTGVPYPFIVHFGIRPPQLSYAGNADYQRAWRRYVKYRHLLSNMPKPSANDKKKLLEKETILQKMRTDSDMKRDVTVELRCDGFRTTGICCDIVQHAMMIPVLVGHLRFHRSLNSLENTIQYKFKNRSNLQLAMTHPSYRENYGTNPDHARNTLTNCGIRQPEYGDRNIHAQPNRKRGITTLINIMARFGAEIEMESEITHNERLEFLGDAVVEFVTSIHLFHLFPDLEEGGLATYRAAIVQNQHLAVLAQEFLLDQYMLYAHGSDLCHDSELRHAMANCFEALMGALFLDGGIDVADRIFGQAFFGKGESGLRGLWENYPPHQLQQEEEKGDRHWIESHNALKKLTEFEESIGIEFTHIRLLARAFTDRSLGFNNLTKGSNQRLEFLGDTVLQLITSEYLYRHFPDHHEGHLSLLRSSMVNNRAQSIVCNDLGMTQYSMRSDPKSEMKMKDRADLLESFLGALYVDKGLLHCLSFCTVCFFPRLSKSIIKQEWNDPKSKLQQCCLTLRTMDGREPDIPEYKVIQSQGPTNTRVYVVAVYFRGERLADAEGHSIQEAEMNAAQKALAQSSHLFPQLVHQRRVLNKTIKKVPAQK